MVFEDFILEQVKQIQELQKQAYQHGFEAGKKAKEKELLDEAEKDEAKLKQIEKDENPF